MKLNRKGYLLVEIIVASVLAMGVAYFLINLTINFSKTDEDVYQSILWTNDKNILTNDLTQKITEDINNSKEVKLEKIDNKIEFTFTDDAGTDNKKYLQINGNKISYDDYEKNIDDNLTIENIEINIKPKYTTITIPMKSIYSDEDYGIKLFLYI